MNVSINRFVEVICKDYGIEPMRKYKMQPKDFPFKRGKRRISCSGDSVIVDKQGNEHPYMISLSPAVRNNERLEDFDHIYVIRHKNLSEVLQETGAEVKKTPCKVCEGGGWYTNGTRYEYKDIYCEI